VLPTLRTTLVDRELDDARRTMALDALLAAKDRELPPLLHRLMDDPKLQLASINALAAFDHKATPEVLIAVYPQLEAAEKQAALATLTSRPDYILALLDAIAEEKLPRTDLSAFTVRQLARLDDERVIKRLNEVWGTIRETSADKAEQMAKFKQQLTPEVLAKANLSHGRAVFNKTCGTCHLLFGSGKEIGPDLTGSNRANLDYLLENLLDPSALVGKDYQITIVATDDGRTITGIVKQETDTAVTLQTPTDVVTIPKAEIEERQLSPLSLMPEGQLGQLKPEEARDLVAYLASSSQVPLPGEGPWLDPSTGKVAGALEGESLKVVERSGGNTGAQGMAAFTKGKWSGDAHLWWTGAKPGDKLSIEIPVEREGRYQVFVVLTKAIDYGIVRLSVDDGTWTEPMDMFNREVVNTQPLSLGLFDLKPGKHRLNVEITGANPAAVKQYMFGLDYVALMPGASESGSEGESE
jgi:putative heme-binding domain-containing protein